MHLTVHLALLAALCAPLSLAGCKRVCAGLDPQVEVTLKPGSLAGSVHCLRVVADLGGDRRSHTFNAQQVGFTAQRDGRLVIQLGAAPVGKLKLDVLACDKATCGSKGGCTASAAVAAGALPATALEPNGCNFLSVTVGKKKPADGGIDAHVDGGAGGCKPVTEAKVTITGEMKDDRITTVAACDLDGDKVDDIVLGAPEADGEYASTQTDAGRVYIFLSRKQGAKLKGSIDLATAKPDVTLLGAVTGDNLGASLACGEIDGNSSHADLVIGAPGGSQDPKDLDSRGKVYVLIGKLNIGSAGIVNLDKDKLDGELVGRNRGDHLGEAVAVVNFTGDGNAFVAMGAPHYSFQGTLPLVDAGAASSGDAGADSGISPDAGAAPDTGGGPDMGPEPAVPDKAGAVFLVPAVNLPGTNKTLELQDQASRAIIVTGCQAGEKLGTALAAGYLDSDTKQDLLASGPGAKKSCPKTSLSPGGTCTGVVRVLRGMTLASPLPKVLPRVGCNGAATHSLNLWGPPSPAGFGESIAVGNLDTEKSEDVAIGAPSSSRVYLFMGQGDLFSSTTKPRDRHIEDEYKALYQGKASSRFSASLAAVRPVVSSTSVDLLVGAPHLDNYRGAVYWLHRDPGFKNREPIDVGKGQDVLRCFTGTEDKGELGARVAGGAIDPGNTNPDLLMSAPGVTVTGRGAAGKIYGWWK